MKKRKSKVYSVSDSEFSEIVEKAISYSDCLRALELTTKGGSSSKILKSRIKELHLDIQHFDRRRGSINVNRRDSDDIFIESSTYNNTSNLKKRAIKERLLKYECYTCKNNGTWNGVNLVLQLDHINGVNDDNRIENLRLLCPNCHSQTKTFCGKNQKKSASCEVESKECLCGNKICKSSNICRSCSNKNQEKISWPSVNELQEMVSVTSYSETGRVLGVSDNAIRKRIKNYL